MCIIKQPSQQTTRTFCVYKCHTHSYQLDHSLYLSNFLDNKDKLL